MGRGIGVAVFLSCSRLSLQTLPWYQGLPTFGARPKGSKLHFQGKCVPQLQCEPASDDQEV